MFIADAHGKINLTLEVLGRREDGLHELASVFQTVELHDTLTFDDAESDELQILNNEALARATEPNLVSVALDALRKRTGVERCAKIVLNKRIPAGAGLGGGSSDAAAVLKSLNVLWDLKLDDAELAEIGFAVGADVPFFMQNGTALVTGAGETIKPITPNNPPAQNVALFVWYGETENKTARAYAKLTPNHYTDGSATQKMVSQIENEANINAENTYNVFDKVSDDLEPIWAQDRQDLQAMSGQKLNLTGAGPTLFALIGDDADIEDLKQRTLDARFRLIVTQMVTGEFEA